LQGLSALLAHQSLAGSILGGGTRLGRLLDHSCSQSVHLLIHGLFNFSQRRFGVCCSPLRHSGKHLLTLVFPLLL
jgi:hypothetical protein